MKYVVAVSGGVDSVVLLDILARQTDAELVVAHFDHGIRDDSAADARFVAELAARYNLPFYTERQELGKTASEEIARRERYNFLLRTANEVGGRLVTAHTRDDVLETIALNIKRGTRWRGVAVMGNLEIKRPLLGRTKHEIYEYAARHRLEWVEDSTNASNRYLRNRLRRQLQRQFSDSDKQALFELWRRQIELRREIDDECEKLQDRVDNRYFLTNIPESVARELLYFLVLKTTGTSLLSRQLDNLLIAIKTGRPGTIWQLNGGVMVKLSRKNVTIERVE